MRACEIRALRSGDARKLIVARAHSAWMAEHALGDQCLTLLMSGVEAEKSFEAPVPHSGTPLSDNLLTCERPFSTIILLQEELHQVSKCS